MKATTYTLFAFAACVTSAFAQQATRTAGVSPIPTVVAGGTLLYARSDEDYNVPADLPVAVRAQLEVMRAPDWQNRAAVVIGPLFPKEWSRDIIANELKYGIARLTGQGRLTESSAFVTAIKSALDTISSAGGAGIPLDQIRSLARTPMEIDVINAISLSLR